MADSIENVYSTALFELCEENDCLEKVFCELGEVKELVFCKENQDFAELLSSPLVKGAEKKNSLCAVFEGRLSVLSLDFLCLLAEKGRFNFFPAIYEDLRRKYNDKMGILEVTAVTSQPLSDRLRKKLTQKLEAVTGKKVVLSEKTDSSILGGILLRYGSVEIDSSVRSRLDKLKAQIDSVIA